MPDGIRSTRDGSPGAWSWDTEWAGQEGVDTRGRAGALLNDWSQARQWHRDFRSSVTEQGPSQSLPPVALVPVWIGQWSLGFSSLWNEQLV